MLPDVQFQRCAGASSGLLLLNVTVADRGQQNPGHTVAGKPASHLPVLCACIYYGHFVMKWDVCSICHKKKVLWLHLAIEAAARQTGGEYIVT